VLRVILCDDAPMDREDVPGGFRLSSDAYVITITRPRPHVELLRAEGRASAEVADAILDHREKILSECGRIAIFDDLEHASGYDSNVRTRLTSWTSKHRPQITTFHILTGSRIVAMGVAVANVALGGSIKAHLKRADFEAALRQATLTG